MAPHLVQAPGSLAGRAAILDLLPLSLLEVPGWLRETITDR